MTPIEKTPFKTIPPDSFAASSKGQKAINALKLYYYRKACLEFASLKERKKAEKEVLKAQRKVLKTTHAFARHVLEKHKLKKQNRKQAASLTPC